MVYSSLCTLTLLFALDSIGLPGRLVVFAKPLRSNGSAFSLRVSGNRGPCLGELIGVFSTMVGFSKLAIRTACGRARFRSGTL